MVWEAYEQRCALITSRSSPVFAADDNDVSSPTSTGSEHDDAINLDSSSTWRRRRRHSTPVLSFAFASSPTEDSPTEQTPFSLASPSASPRVARPQKLRFVDYLIKPVQRICKYPLLLDQLQDKRRYHAGDPTVGATGPTSDALDKAARAMQAIVSRVNRASETEAHNLRSALIASRLSFVAARPLSTPTPASSECTTSSHETSSTSSTAGTGTGSTAPTSPSSSCAPLPALPPPQPHPRPVSLTAEFVSSLGPCKLAGALDVVQFPTHRAKYLGAFLYAGGYCILAKVTKGGRVYEPRHWFSLSEVELVDVEDDNGEPA